MLLMTKYRSKFLTSPLRGASVSGLYEAGELQEDFLRQGLSLAYGMWLSLVERCIWDAEVARSNRVIPTIQSWKSIG